MPDYKKMYLDLFNSVTDAIEILCEAQKRAEETFVDTSGVREETTKHLKLIRPEE